MHSDAATAPVVAQRPRDPERHQEVRHVPGGKSRLPGREPPRYLNLWDSLQSPNDMISAHHGVTQVHSRVGIAVRSDGICGFTGISD